MRNSRSNLMRIIVWPVCVLSLVATLNASLNEPTEPLPRRALAGGILYFSVDGDSNGLYRLSTTDGTATLLGATSVVGGNVGLTPSSDPSVLYGSKWAALLHINSDGSGTTDLGGEASTGLAYDGSTGTLFAVFNGDFFTMNAATGAKIADLGTTPANVSGLAFGDGRVYGLGGGNNLYVFDPGTSQWALIGDTGVHWENVGLAWDSATGSLYGKRINSTQLFRIDPTTAVTVSVGDTGIGSGGGLAFVSLPEAIFSDGFDSGNTGFWSAVVN